MSLSIAAFISLKLGEEGEGVLLFDREIHSKRWPLTFTVVRTQVFSCSFLAAFACSFPIPSVKRRVEGSECLHLTGAQERMEETGSIPDAPEAHSGGILICVLLSDILY